MKPTDKYLLNIKWILNMIQVVFPNRATIPEQRHSITVAPNIQVELLIWFEGERWSMPLSDDMRMDDLPELLDHFKVDCIEQLAQRRGSKQFKIVSVSKNANSFGLHGHVLLAHDGEGWEVGRHRTGPHEGEWNKGDLITIAKRSAAPDDYAWAENSCEIPRRLPPAPLQFIEEIFPKTKPSTNQTQLSK
jgi:hypothetical protein